MNRPTKLALGAVTVWPVLCFGLLFVALAPSSSPDGQGTHLPPAMFVAMFYLLAGSLLLGLIALPIFYVVHALRHLPSAQQARWIVLLLIGQVVTMPLYWYLKIWKAHDPST